MDKTSNLELGGITQKVADFVIGSTIDDLPASAILKTKQILLDSIGCALCGHIIDRTRIALELVGDLGGKPQSTIIGNGKSSYALSAFANGELIGALDYDPVGPLSPHITPYVLPACLALAEKQGVSGKDLITALAIGHEVGGRMGSSICSFMVLKEDPPYYEWSPRFSYTSAVFGAVVGAGKILNLNNEQLLNAMGIAGASTPIPAGVKWEHTGGPSMMLKFGCWSGWIAQLAVVAALAAEKGFTGDTTILDGEHGFWKMYGSPFFKVDNLLGDLGSVWHLNEVWFKPHTTCGLNLGIIEGVSKIVQENAINPAEITGIYIKGAPQLLIPNRSQTEIKSFEDAQFNPAAAAALAVFYGQRPGPHWQLPITFNDHEVKRLMKLVKIEIHPDAEAAITNAAKAGKIQGFFGATIGITTKDRYFVIEITQAKGSLKNPMTEEELLDKFRNNASYSVLQSDKIEKIIEMVYNLDKIRDITELTTILA